MSWRHLRLALLVLAVLAVIVLVGAARILRGHPNVLWMIVNEKCVPDMQAHGTPAPCSEVSLAAGYTVLKDLRGAYQFLLIPTHRVTGIEDPYVRAANAPDYFAEAWAAKHWLEGRLGHAVPRQDVALAVNSWFGRSQNQLHIHIDCLRPDVATALAGSNTGDGWGSMTLPPYGHVYEVRKLDSADLTGVNPFQLAAQSPRAGSDMGHDTVIVAGAADGFYLLVGRANLLRLNLGAGSELEDPSCAIAKP